MEFETLDLSACMPCLYILANGEYQDGTPWDGDGPSTEERIAEAWARLWGDNIRDMVNGGECKCEARETGDDCLCDILGYRTSACDLCGDANHGDRYAVTLLSPMVRDPFTGERVSRYRLLYTLAEMKRYA